MLAASQMQRGSTRRRSPRWNRSSTADGGSPIPRCSRWPAKRTCRRKQYAKATQYFEKAAALDPQNAATRISLGKVRMATGDTDRAIADLEAAAALGAGGAQADIMLAISNLRRKEFDQALKTIAKLESMPDNTMIVNLKAAAYMGKGDMAKARAQLERALKIDPAYFPAAANLAQLDLQAGNPAAARKRYEAVLEKDKNQVPAMLALADIVSRARGQEKEVLDWIKRAKAAHPVGGACPGGNRALSAHRPDRKGARVRARAQDGAPGNPDPDLVVGQVLVAMGHTADAVAVFRDRAVLLPNSPEAQFDLAQAQMATKYPLAAANTLPTRCASGRLSRGRARWWPSRWPRTATTRDSEVARGVQHDMPNAPLGYVLEGDVLMAASETRRRPPCTKRDTRYARVGWSRSRSTTHGQAGKPEQGEARLKDGWRSIRKTS